MPRASQLVIPLKNGKFDYVKILDEVSYYKDVSGRPMMYTNALGKKVPMSFTIEIEPGRGWTAHFNLPPGSVPQGMPLSGTF